MLTKRLTIRGFIVRDFADHLLVEKFPRFVRVIRYEEMVADPAAALRVAADLCGLAVPEQPVPAVGDDRGCAEPYRQFLATEA